MIIQEDMIMQKILQYLLLSLNFEVKVYSSFTEIDLEDQHTPFDVVLTDILFDAISPIEFVLQLQESVNCRNVIVVTNMGQARIAKTISGLPAVKGFFGIPFDLELLEQNLKML